VLKEPIFGLWLAVILGVIGSAYPTSFPWMMAVLLILLLAKHRKLVVLGTTLGLLLGGFNWNHGAVSKLQKSTYEKIYGIPLERRVPLKIPHWDFREKLRNNLRSTLQSSSSLLSSLRETLILGEGRKIPSSIWESFHYLGLSHLLVVSGLHLSLLAALCLIFLRKVFEVAHLRSYLLFRGFVFLVLSGFFFICNWKLSLFRAFLGFCLLGLFSWFVPALHRYSGSERLASVGLLLAFLFPQSVVEPSYLYTFAASYAFLRSQEWTERGPKFFTIAYPFILLFPLSTVYGFEIHYLSPFLNLLVIPAFFLILVPMTLISGICSKLEPMAERLLVWFFESLQNLFQILTYRNALPPWMGGLLIIFILLIFHPKGFVLLIE